MASHLPAGSPGRGHLVAASFQEHSVGSCKASRSLDLELVHGNCHHVVLIKVGLKTIPDSRGPYLQVGGTGAVLWSFLPCPIFQWKKTEVGEERDGQLLLFINTIVLLEFKKSCLYPHYFCNNNNNDNIQI